ncbi:SOUL family heme-binding protein [Lysobacter soli]|uniref:SOUL family heme-binding protein n=1 Tax=Lysobacter soli TaxID=453783 RepID=UPI003CF3FCFB
MSGATAPLFTDVLKLIPRFFGIRLDARPAYRMEDLVGPVEIRRYAPALFVHTSADGSHDAAVRVAREKLEDYIYYPTYQGDDESTMFPSALRMRERHGWRVAFFLSNNLAAGEAPLPDDPTVRVHESQETLVAVLGYRGADTEESRIAAKRDLMQALSGSRWSADDQVYWATYDQAFAIPYLKKNEVHVRVANSKTEIVVSAKVDEACNSHIEAANQA